MAILAIAAVLVLIFGLSAGARSSIEDEYRREMGQVMLREYRRREIELRLEQDEPAREKTKLKVIR